MNTLTDSTDDLAQAAHQRRQRWLLVLALALIAPSAYFIWRHFAGPSIVVETEAPRPLLKRGAGEFHDSDARVRFTPPANWSMQARTTETPVKHLKDRMMVKYKRLLPGQSAAWLRVYLSDAVPGKSLVDAVNDRDPGPGWKRVTKAESQSIGGHVAAKATYWGFYNNAISVRQVIGLQRDDQVFFFIATFPALDRDAEQQTQQAIASIVFER